MVFKLKLCDDYPSAQLSEARLLTGKICKPEIKSVHDSIRVQPLICLAINFKVYHFNRFVYTNVWESS